MSKKPDDEQEYIFRPWITVKGKRVYAKKGRVFRIPINGDKKR